MNPRNVFLFFLGMLIACILLLVFLENHSSNKSVRPVARGIKSF